MRNQLRQLTHRLSRLNFSLIVFVASSITTLALFSLPAHADRVTYQYDGSGRLKKTTYPDSSETEYKLDAAGNRTNVVVSTPDATAPSSPGAVNFSGVVYNAMTVNWGAATDNVGVTGYDYQVNSGAWQSLGNVLTVNLTGLTASTSYNVKVRARDAAGNVSATPGSNTTTTPAAPDTTPPSSPGAVNFSGVVYNAMTVNWGAATDNVGVTGYDYQVNSGAWQSLGNVLTVNLTGLTASTSYNVKVRARDAAGNVSATPSSNTTTTPAAPDTTPPSSPGAVNFSGVVYNAMTVNWGAATDNVGVTGYDYQVNGGAWQSLGNVLTVNLTGLSGSTSYTVAVRARDAAGNVSTTPSSNTTTTPAPPDTTPPSSPGAVGFSGVTYNAMTVSWGAATDNVGVTGYDYQVNGGAWQSLGNVLTVNLTGLSASTSYTVAVRARDAAGNVSAIPSSNTTTTPAAPDTTPPSSPGAVGFSGVTYNAMTVSWGAATDNVGVTGYDYQVNGGAWQSLGNVLTVNLTGLSASTSYTVAVRARDAAGNVSATPSSNTTTTPAAATPGVLQFEVNATNPIDERSGWVFINVTRTGASGAFGPASVQCSTSDGNMIAGADYVAMSQTLNWGAGDASPKTCQVSIIDESTWPSQFCGSTGESGGPTACLPQKAFVFNLSNASGASLGSVTKALGVVIDDEYNF